MATKARVELVDQARRLLGEIAGEPQHLRHAPAVMRHDAGRRVDREGHDLLGRVVRDLLDVHAAFGRDHERDARGFAVDQRREIELAVDRRAFLDVEPVDLLAVRPGLVRDQHRAEQPLRLPAHVLDRLDDLDAAGLAAAAGVDLRLDDDDRPSRDRPPPSTASSTVKTACPRGTGTPNSRSTALAWYSWMFMTPPQSPRIPASGSELIAGLAQQHRDIRYFPRCGAIFLQASTSVCTASTDLSNIARSAPLSWISTIRSIPFAPMTAGTPT